MKIAYLDTIAGISGDMTIGAFLSAGVPFDHLKSQLNKIKLSGYEISQKNIVRCGINAIKFEVNVFESELKHRHLKDIIKIIHDSDLANDVKRISEKIFNILANAEAKVHNTTVEKIHFHEVGAIDSIVDIIGTAICLDYLKIKQLFTSPIKLGSGGFIETEHGNLPIPTPAVVEILKDYPVTLTDLEYELTTPTGAAIVKTLSSGILKNQEIQVHSIGYGSGTRDLPIPNLLRVLIGELEKQILEEDLLLVETNIDNMNPEIYPYIIEKLILNGAHDAYLVPIIMKKGRPGILLSTLISRSLLEKISDIIFKETTTLGLRVIEVGRKKIFREIKTINTMFGAVKIKVIDVDGQVRCVPEFEECKRIAIERNIPIMEVYKQVEKELKD